MLVYKFGYFSVCPVLGLLYFSADCFLMARQCLCFFQNIIHGISCKATLSDHSVEVILGLISNNVFSFS